MDNRARSVISKATETNKFKITRVNISDGVICVFSVGISLQKDSIPRHGVARYRIGGHL